MYLFESSRETLLISELGFCRPDDMQLFVWRFKHELGWGAQRDVS